LATKIKLSARYARLLTSMRMLKSLEKEMKQAAKALEFERAALIRDRIVELRKESQGLRVR